MITDTTTAPPAEPSVSAPAVPPRADRQRYFYGLMDRGMTLLKLIDRAEAQGDLVGAARFSRALTTAYATLERTTR